MISRVADHCFWLGRYLDRAESTARVLSVTSHLSLDAELTPEQCWLPVIIVSGEREHFFQKHGEGAARSGEIVQRYMTWEDDDNFTCIQRSIAAARENARSIREVLTLEGWETTNELYLWMSSPEARTEYERDRDGFYRHVRRGVQLILGLLRSTMLHDTPLDFIWLGVMLERIGQTARVLDVHHHAFMNLAGIQDVVGTALWLSLLRACSGFEPFMKRNQGRVTGAAVASFLIFEPSFPRSIRFCVDAASARFFEAIRPSDQPSLPGGATAARLSSLASWLRARAEEPLPADVHELLTHVVDETAAVCNLLSRELFLAQTAPAEPPPVSPVETSGQSTQSQTQYGA
ncbi:hypothetical protein A7982_02269 [Minicystis rosea]|nr:hypothetical protein A7982_02269 [Minicystis rosea]